MIELTRRYRFPAAHILCHDSFTPEENRRVFGKCANPGGHGHNYGLEVTVAGPIDERTGELMSREGLDSLVEERVLSRFGHRMLNDDELFRDRVPTAENLAGAIFARLEGPIFQAGSARLRRVRVLETPRNAFIYGDTR
jgi:6-pyruvoyltetrahydropterin/6-carboxytetrahydropterin synthase